MSGKSKIKNKAIGSPSFAEVPFAQSFRFDSTTVTFDSTILWTWDNNV